MKVAPYDFLQADEQLSKEEMHAVQKDSHLWVADGLYPLLPWSCCVLNSVPWDTAPTPRAVLQCAAHQQVRKVFSGLAAAKCLYLHKPLFSTCKVCVQPAEHRQRSLRKRPGQAATGTSLQRASWRMRYLEAFSRPLYQVTFAQVMPSRVFRTLL